MSQNGHPRMWDNGPMPLVPRSLSCTLLLITLSVPPPAAAAPRMVVDLSASGDAAEVLAPLRAAFGPSYDADVVDVPGALARTGGAWSFLAPAVAEPWDVEPIAAVEVAAAMEAIEAQMQAVDHGAAQGRLEELQRRLAACPDPVPAGTLARIPFLLGIIHFYAGDAEAARGAFQQAAERDPEMDWDTNFAPEPQQVFLAGLADAVRAPRTTLAIDPGDRPVRLWVDGVEVPVGAREHMLVGEEHLVQYGEAGGPLATVVLRTGGAARTALVGPRSVEKGLSGTPDSEAGRPVFRMLASRARRAGYTEVLVVGGPDAEMAWLHDDRVGAWARVSLVLGRKLAQARGFQAVGGLLVGVGAAVAVSGAVFGVVSHDRGQDAYQTMQLDDGTISPGLYDLHHADYEQYQQDASTGWTLFAIGGAALAAGIPLTAHGVSLQRAAMQDPGVLLAAGPGGFTVGLRGDF